ncbi:MAG: AMP-dependent synthetase/ligase, partial [Armatimonadota bacterium]
MPDSPLPTPTGNTTVELFRAAAARRGDAEALLWREGKEWKSLNWSQAAQRVDALAAALARRGIVAGDRIGIVSENQPNWAIADLAHATLGITTVGIYPTLPPPQIEYILRDCGARAIFVQDAKQLAKVVAVRANVPTLEAVFLLEGEDPEGLAVPIAALYAEGADLPAPRPTVDSESVACLIYTSGTTGDPKGAMLTHRNLVDNCVNSLAHFRNGNVGITESDTFLSFLPLAHSFERIIHLFALAAGARIAYSQGARTLMDEMASVKPTVMGCVPRVFEAMQERILDGVAKQPEKRRKLFHAALSAGRAMVDARQAGRSPGLLATLRHAVLDHLVLSKLRERFGGQWRFFISGGAALNPETARFFHSIGFALLEGYGLTETSPVISVNPAPRPKIGTVGTVIPGGEVRIAEDGEVLYRGRNVMKGYFGNEQATRDMIDTEGWLHTGDIGTL